MFKEGDVRIPSGCAISGIMNTKGIAFSGEKIIQSISLMHERSNGLGGGFAGYGIYPHFKDYYAFHLFFDSISAKVDAEMYLSQHYHVEFDEAIPTRNTSSIIDPPIIWRYFIKPKAEKLIKSGIDEEEFIVRSVMNLNRTIEGAYVFSSGKNMGIFKGVGYPEDIGNFFRLEEYQGHIWTAHGRFPTNTPGWWGGAHPFALLDRSVVHNGEISSYDANRRFLQMHGYTCALQTDTEAITYIFDLLLRQFCVPLEVAAAVVAAPFWSEIERMDQEKKELYTALRAVYGSLLINGPFSIILASNCGIMALNDRLKLRPMTAATKNEFLFIASEEAAIREICPIPDRVWAPRGGQPVFGLLESASHSRDVLWEVPLAAGYPS